MDGVIQALAEHEGPCVTAIDEVPSWSGVSQLRAPARLTNSGERLEVSSCASCFATGRTRARGFGMVVTNRVNPEPVLQQAGLTVRMSQATDGPR